MARRVVKREVISKPPVEQWPPVPPAEVVVLVDGHEYAVEFVHHGGSPVSDWSHVAYCRVTKDGETVETSTAKCSRQDDFDWEYGQKRALRRALDPVKSSLPRDVRTAIWEAYDPYGRALAASRPVLEFAQEIDEAIDAAHVWGAQYVLESLATAKGAAVAAETYRNLKAIVQGH